MDIGNRISQFIAALDEEIQTQKSGKGGNIIGIQNGNFLRRSAGYFIYSFRLQNPLEILDDTPCLFKANGIDHQCNILSVDGTMIKLAVENWIGENVPHAQLVIQLWFLLELLKKKYQESFPRCNSIYGSAETVFMGKSDILDTADTAPDYISDTPPNPAQEDAVISSFSKSLCVIWGPPGTGKTHTIALAIQAHINAGNKVLLLSHANTAVDEALEKVAKNLCDTPLYHDARLLRFGPHKKDTLSNYPMVLPDHAADIKGRELIEEKNNLKDKSEIISKELDEVELTLGNIRICDEIKHEVKSLTKSINRLKDKLSKTYNSLKAVRKEKWNKTRLLNEARQSSRFRRIIKRLNPKRLQLQTDQLTMAITTMDSEAVELESRIADLHTEYNEKQKRKHMYETEIDRILGERGLTAEVAKSRSKMLKVDLDSINIRVKEIDDLLSKIRDEIMKGAHLIATTLTKTFASGNFPEIEFDIVIVDEVSMAPLPYLYWAITFATKGVTLVGDFQQLPPICTSKKNKQFAQKWLRRNVFDLLNINLDTSRDDQRVTMLNIQYRMHPDVAAIPNTLFYDNNLRNHYETADNLFHEPLTGNESLVLVDTSHLNPWCSQVPSGGRFNIISAELAIEIAMKIQANCDKSIGVIAPYRHQVRLLARVAADLKIIDRIRINTIHSFQGGEEDVIIIDIVEGVGAKRWSMFVDAEDANKLLNVAISRTRSKLILIANRGLVLDRYPSNSYLHTIIHHIESHGVTINASSILPQEQFVAQFSDNLDLTDHELHDLNMNIAFYNETDFWIQFKNDLEHAKDTVIIMSPFIGINRINRVRPTLERLREKKVVVTIITRPPIEQGSRLKEHAEEIIGYLESIGIIIYQRRKIHQKIAVVDNYINWFGSLNILSHNDTNEQMARMCGTQTAMELIKILELDDIFAVGNFTGDFCPECKKKGIMDPLEIKMGRYGKFKGSSLYPKCKFIDKQWKMRNKRNTHQDLFDG